MIVHDRQTALDVYAEASRRGRPLVCLGAENRVTVHAALEATRRASARCGENIPVVIALTVNYAPRPQACHYSLVDDWRLGLQMFLSDVELLAGPIGPYADLTVMTHLDHVCPPVDEELLQSELVGEFSSILFDASHLPLGENAQSTRAFVNRWGPHMVIEAACDELHESSDLVDMRSPERTPAEVAQFVEESGCDLVVVDLGTEHRATGNGALRYRREQARALAAAVGPRLVLHGGSSVAAESLGQLGQDGVVKVNLWTALERRATVAVVRDFLAQPAGWIGEEIHADWATRALHPTSMETSAQVALFPAAHRDRVMLSAMTSYAQEFLEACEPERMS